MGEGVLADDLEPLVVGHVVGQRGEHRQRRVLLLVVHLNQCAVLVPYPTAQDLNSIKFTQPPILQI